MLLQKRPIFIKEPSTGLWLIARIAPKALVILLAIVGILIAAAITYAVYTDHPVTFFGLSIARSNAELVSEIDELKKQLTTRPTHEEVDQLKAEMTRVLTPSDLSDIWDSRMSKTEVVNTIRELKKSKQEYERFAASIEFMFLRLEREIEQAGGFINTNVSTGNDREIFRLIQAALRSINAFEGTVDGEQRSTNTALIAFQNAYNAEVSEGLELKPLGFFGRRTLALIRATYLSTGQGS